MSNVSFLLMAKELKQKTLWNSRSNRTKKKGWFIPLGKGKESNGLKWGRVAEKTRGVWEV